MNIRLNIIILNEDGAIIKKNIIYRSRKAEA